MKHLLIVLTLLMVAGRSAEASTIDDENLHVLLGTVNGCDCDFYPNTADWICHTNITLAGPAPHFSPTNTTMIRVEVEGQAIGQCSAMTTPARAKVFFWLQAAGTDYLRGMERSTVRVYYMAALGF